MCVDEGYSLTGVFRLGKEAVKNMVGVVPG